MNDPRTLTLRTRCWLAAIAVVLSALMAMARTVTPDPRGYGTHQQFGLAACAFTQLSGWRCPTCGMTTAWAHGVRGNVAAALAASGGGTMLLAVAAAATPWLFASAIVGRWFGARPTAPVLLGIAGAWLAVTILDWLRRVAVD